MLKHSLFKFFSSLKLAVFSILSLAFVLAYATVFESLFGTRAAYVAIYGTLWFAGVLGMLAFNVLCAALSRYPWKKHQTGFVITHLGILVLLFGSYLTQKWGVDGNMPISEGGQENEVILNDLRLSVGEEEGTADTFPIQESYKAQDGRILRVDFQEGQSLVVDRFIPRAVFEKKILPSPIKGIGGPALKVELFNERFRISESLILESPEKPMEVNLGPAVITFQKLWTAKEEGQFLAAKAKKVEAPKLGYVIATYRGKEFRLEVGSSLNQWTNIAGGQFEVRVEKYFPYAVVENNELTSRSEEPMNPAVQVSLRRKGGAEVERHTVFAIYPEFSTLHGEKQKKETMGVKFKMQAAARSKPQLAGVGRERGELAFAQSADDQKLYYRVRGKDGSINAQGTAKIGENISTGWMNLKFNVIEWLGTAVQRELPRPVHYISGSGDNYFNAIHITESEAARQKSNDDGFWLSEGMGRLMNIGGRELYIQFSKQKLTLPFQIHLEKFTMGTDPGTSKAATYESDVIVKDLPNAIEQKGHISMNEPLVYGGYTFYQASYALEEGRPPVSVLAVNYDPGRSLKYLGSLIIVLGIFIMFYMNPQYFAKIFSKKGTPK